MPSETLRRPIRRADNHSHIIQAGIQDMVAAARKNNLDEYSITEHVSQFAVRRRLVEFGSVHASGRMFESREEYIEEFRKIDSRTRGVVRLNRGLEVDFSPRFLDSVGDFVNRAKGIFCSAPFTNSETGEMSRESPEYEA